MSVGVGVLAVDPFVPLQLFPEDGREALTVVVVFTFLLGVMAIYNGVRTRQRANRLDAIEDTEPGRVIDGPVATGGTARATDEQLESPTGEGTVIAYEVDTTEVETKWESEEAARDPRAGIDEQETEFTRTTSTDAVPFTITGDLGTVRVDPTRDVRLELHTTEEGTEVVDDPDPYLTVRRELRRDFSLLRDGDDVYVFGTASRTAGDPDVDAVIGPDPELGELIVSTRNHETLVDHYRMAAPVALILGLVVATGSLAVLVYEYLLA